MCVVNTNGIEPLTAGTSHQYSTSELCIHCNLCKNRTHSFRGWNPNRTKSCTGRVLQREEALIPNLYDPSR